MPLRGLAVRSRVPHRIALLLVSLLALSAEAFSQGPRDALQSLIGQPFLLARVAGSGKIKLKKSQLDRLKGACDMAALATSATWKSGTAQVELQYIGTPVLANRKPSGCQTNDTSVLEISGFAADEPANSLAEAIHQVLQTPEQYLRANGIDVDLAPLSDEETPVKLAPPMSAPVALLSVNGIYTPTARAVHISGTVLLRLYVGTDGRAHNVRIQRPLGFGLDERALKVLPLWRFQPARQGGKPVAFSAPSACRSSFFRDDLLHSLRHKPF
jgi:TonB family protein